MFILPDTKIVSRKDARYRDKIAKEKALDYLVYLRRQYGCLSDEYIKAYLSEILKAEVWEHAEVSKDEFVTLLKALLKHKFSKSLHRDFLPADIVKLIFRRLFIIPKDGKEPTSDLIIEKLRENLRIFYDVLSRNMKYCAVEEIYVPKRNGISLSYDFLSSLLDIEVLNISRTALEKVIADDLKRYPFKEGEERKFWQSWHEIDTPRANPRYLRVLEDVKLEAQLEIFNICRRFIGKNPHNYLDVKWLAYLEVPFQYRLKYLKSLLYLNYPDLGEKIDLIEQRIEKRDGAAKSRMYLERLDELIRYFGEYRSRHIVLLRDMDDFKELFLSELLELESALDREVLSSLSGELKKTVQSNRLPAHQLLRILVEVSSDSLLSESEKRIKEQLRGISLERLKLEIDELLSSVTIEGVPDELRDLLPQLHPGMYPYSPLIATILMYGILIPRDEWMQPKTEGNLSFRQLLNLVIRFFKTRSTSLVEIKFKWQISPFIIDYLIIKNASEVDVISNRSYFSCLVSEPVDSLVYELLSKDPSLQDAIKGFSQYRGFFGQAGVIQDINDLFKLTDKYFEGAQQDTIVRFSECPGFFGQTGVVKDINDLFKLIDKYFKEAQQDTILRFSRCPGFFGKSGAIPHSRKVFKLLEEFFKREPEAREAIRSFEENVKFMQSGKSATVRSARNKFRVKKILGKKQKGGDETFYSDLDRREEALRLLSEDYVDRVEETTASLSSGSCSDGDSSDRGVQFSSTS